MLSNLIQSFCGFSLLLVSFFLNAPLMAQKTPDRLKTIQQRQALESKSPLNSIKFRNIGPSVMSGRVVDVEGNPEDPTEFYVAYATGGLWHTTNNGQSFVPIFDSADVITIGDIAVNWKTRTIWVGTGEVNSSRSSYAGMGIYKSRDEGRPGNTSDCPNHNISERSSFIQQTTILPG